MTNLEKLKATFPNVTFVQKKDTRTLMISEQWLNSEYDEPKLYWVPTEYDGYADGNPVCEYWECPNCGYEHHGDSDTLTAYCPDCGKMLRIKGEFIGPLEELGE